MVNIYLIYVRDAAYLHLLPAAAAEGRVRVMAFPPLGIQTLAPVLRQAGHRVRMFDTCHPHMRAQDIADAAREECPDVIALSFLSVTAYPAMKNLARTVKLANPRIPIVVGGAFASINAARILPDCPYVDHVGVGEGEELLPDYLAHLTEPEAVDGLVWRRDGTVVQNPPRADPRSGPVPLSRPGEPAHRLCRVPAARRAGRAVARSLLHDADVARVPVHLHLPRHSPRWPRGPGGTDRPRTCWARCSSSPIRATARSTSPTITSS